MADSLVAAVVQAARDVTGPGTALLAYPITRGAIVPGSRNLRDVVRGQSEPVAAGPAGQRLGRARPTCVLYAAASRK
ncbi:hypothetical protein ABZV31_07705 [Streptomyces sp. NPDC005202]|uniref:hypothetical protein n=1 Tax=Streptomyces sp. NPDC005202 TaxID=3157021 RepID=UPI0033A332FC